MQKEVSKKWLKKVENDEVSYKLSKEDKDALIKYLQSNENVNLKLVMKEQEHTDEQGKKERDEVFFLVPSSDVASIEMKSAATISSGGLEIPPCPWKC
jgi:type III secretory pathway component EscR